MRHRVLPYVLRHVLRHVRRPATHCTTHCTTQATYYLLTYLLTYLLLTYYGQVEASAPSLWVRNVQLCVFSVPLAAVGVAYQWPKIQARCRSSYTPLPCHPLPCHHLATNLATHLALLLPLALLRSLPLPLALLLPLTLLRHHKQAAGGPLSGFDAYANSLVVLNAAGGLVVAVVVKYGDNVLKNFTTSCSVILGTIISVFLFDFHLTAQFAWGATLVMFSAYIYGTPPLSHTALAPPSHRPHPPPSPHPPPRCPGRAALLGDAASEDHATSALNCRDSFVNCLAFLDCFSDAHSARGKARRPRLLPTPYPTRTRARARARTHRHTQHTQANTLCFHPPSLPPTPPHIARLLCPHARTPVRLELLPRGAARRRGGEGALGHGP